MGPLIRALIWLLLRAWPRELRERYGPEMRELFAWRLERAGPLHRRVGRGAAMAWDLLREGLAARASAGRTVRRTLGTGGDGMIARAWSEASEAARRVARAPLFTVTAVLLVGVGAGLNLAVFTVVDAVLLRPPPWDDPERVVTVYQDGDDGRPSSSSFPAAMEMAERTSVFSGVTAASPDAVTWETPDGPRRASAEFVTANHFQVLGMPLSAGPGFEPSHDRVGAGLYAIVNRRTWEREMGADPDVVGSTIRLNGHPVTIVGVGPEGYGGILGAVVTDFWLSISSTPVGGPFRVANLERRQDHWYDVRARLAPGATVEQARAAMDALASSLAERFPEMNEGRGISVFASGEIRVHPEIDAQAVPAAVAIMTVSGLVLVLVATNLANLLLVRGLSRGPEVAVRQALGAGRGRIARLFLLEALILAGAGGLLGLLLARWSLDLVPILPLPVPGALALSVDVRTVAFAGGLIVLTALLFGGGPAFRAAGRDVAGALREGGSRSSTGRRNSLFGRVLIGAQVAASVALLAGALLLGRDVVRLQSVEVGVDADRVAWLGTNLRADPVEDRTRLETLRERVEGLPGVEVAALASHLPVQFGGTSTTVVDGYEPPSGTGSVELRVLAVGSGYFRALGIPLLRGRTFGPEDRTGAPRVAVVNETFARRYWGDLDPTGRRIRPQSAPDGWMPVVGVVGDVRTTRLREPPAPVYYLSAEQAGLNTAFLVARTEGDPSELVPHLREARDAVAPSLPLEGLGTLDDHIGSTLALPRVAASLVGAFSLLALFLASLGIYAVVSFTVTRRRAEMGIRLALGSGRGRMVRLVMQQALGAVALGLVVGAAGAALLATLLGGLLSTVSGPEPGTLMAATLLLALSAVTAAGVPAVRAARSDPTEALRTD